MLDLIVPDQLSIIRKANLPNVKIRLRVRSGLPTREFAGNLLHDRIGKKVVKEEIAPLKNLSMVYLCGPSGMVKDIHDSLLNVRIPEEKIFFV